MKTSTSVLALLALAAPLAAATGTATPSASASSAKTSGSAKPNANSHQDNTFGLKVEVSEDSMKSNPAALSAVQNRWVTSIRVADDRFHNKKAMMVDLNVNDDYNFSINSTDHSLMYYSHQKENKANTLNIDLTPKGDLSSLLLMINLQREPAPQGYTKATAKIVKEQGKEYLTLDVGKVKKEETFLHCFDTGSFDNKENKNRDVDLKEITWGTKDYKGCAPIKLMVEKKKVEKRGSHSAKFRM